MDTLIFLVITGGLVAVALDRGRLVSLGILGVGLFAALLMFNHHVTDPLGYFY
ncbi:DUF5993 family protein [Nocardiopsis sp. FIRDI 009]|uniref:DUF5993 family protein n=1 Tax=Nocardiopsis sp. FIRDI 009 TaxID=714197 RepID=UPI001300A488|nr:DUF5993 family protein [Nocardiopsis sp. FIRDI 009]